LKRDWTEVVAWLLLLIIIANQYYSFDYSFSLIVVASIDIIAIWVLRKRLPLILATGKPFGDPRVLLPFDSWQVYLFDFENEHESLTDRLIAIFENANLYRSSWKKETITYQISDDIEQRDQYVLSLNRGLVFVRIHSYGDGLYIEWDAYLNLGSWYESPIAHGIHRQTGRPTTVHSLEPGWEMCSKYDLADLNCLSEWVHGKLTKLIKNYLAERKIDQEIDFKILRSDRDKILTQQQQKAGSETFGNRWKDRASLFSHRPKSFGATSGSQSKDNGEAA
jgi:hypothetical protein